MLPPPKIDEFSLCFIPFQFYSFHPGLDVMHGFFHDGNGVVFWWCFINFLVLVISGFKVLLIEWSSTKPLRVSESGTISDSVEA